MTVNTTIFRKDYIGDGVTTVFPYDFPIASATEMDVWVSGEWMEYGTHYIITGAGDSVGGNVLFLAPFPPADTAPIIIIRNTILEQQQDYEPGGPWPADTIEFGYDMSVMRDQEISGDLSRAALMPLSFTGTQIILPEPSAGLVLGWNATEDGIINIPITGGAVPIPYGDDGDVLTVLPGGTDIGWEASVTGSAAITVNTGITTQIDAAIGDAFKTINVNNEGTDYRLDYTIPIPNRDISREGGFPAEVGQIPQIFDSGAPPIGTQTDFRYKLVDPITASGLPLPDTADYILIADGADYILSPIPEQVPLADPAVDGTTLKVVSNAWTKEAPRFPALPSGTANDILQLNASRTEYDLKSFAEAGIISIPTLGHKFEMLRVNAASDGYDFVPQIVQPVPVSTFLPQNSYDEVGGLGTIFPATITQLDIEGYILFNTNMGYVFDKDDGQDPSLARDYINGKAVLPSSDFGYNLHIKWGVISDGFQGLNALFAIRIYFLNEDKRYYVQAFSDWDIKFSTEIEYTNSLQKLQTSIFTDFDIGGDITYPLIKQTELESNRQEILIMFARNCTDTADDLTENVFLDDIWLEPILDIS